MKSHSLRPGSSPADEDQLRAGAARARRLGGLAALCCLAVWCVSNAAAQSPAEDDLAKGMELYRARKYDDAIERLYAAVRVMANDPERQDTLSRAFVFVAASYLGLDEKLAAQKAFVQAVRANPSVATEPEGFPAETERFFREARPDIDVSSLPPRPTPTPVPVTGADVLRRSTDANLERGAAQSLAGESVAAATTLWAVVGSLEGKPDARVLRPRALLFLALAYASVAREADARGMLKEVLLQVPDLTVPAETFPASFVALFESVKQGLPQQ